MQKKCSARQAEELEDGPGDPFGDGVRIGNRHQLVNLRQIRDLGFETGGMDDGARQVRRDGQRIARIGKEGGPRNANVARPPLAIHRAVVQHDADETLARRSVQPVAVIDVDDDHPASLALVTIDERVRGSGVAEKRQKLASAVNADGVLRHGSRESTRTVIVRGCEEIASEGTVIQSRRRHAAAERRRCRRTAKELKLRGSG